MDISVARRFSQYLGVMLFIGLAGCNILGDDDATVAEGAPCNIEGQQLGDLICRDGAWQRESLDASMDLNNAMVDMFNASDLPPSDMEDVVADMAPVDMSPDQEMSPPANQSQGCRQPQSLNGGVFAFEHFGTMRQYAVRLPTGYRPDVSWPLVIAFHNNSFSLSQWDAEDDERALKPLLMDNAILILPEAIGKLWRDYMIPESAWPSRLEVELQYMGEVIKQVHENWCVQTNKQAVVGVGAGGSFAATLACRREDIHAMAIGHAVTYFDPTRCVKRAMPVWMTNMTDEDVPTRRALLDVFRGHANCADTTTPLPMGMCRAFQSCDAPVHYCLHGESTKWPSFGSVAAVDFFELVGVLPDAR